MLIGRTEEIAKLNTQLDQVREGISGAVMLWGEAGIGKMALLNATVESAQDLSVHRVHEMKLGYGALHRLLLPTSPGCDTSPSPSVTPSSRPSGSPRWPPPTDS